MKQKLIFILTLVMCIKVCNSQVRHKMFVGSGNSGQYKLNIIPIKYDSNVSDLKILQCVDSLPGGLFHSKMYNLLYADDSGKMALQVNEGAYLFHTRFEVVEYWKNGNIKRITYYTKRLKRYWSFGYYADASPKFKGKFNGDRKKGKWRYFNAEGKMIKMEKYAADGTIKTSKDCNPPKQTCTTTFNPKHPKGMPYIIQ